MARIVLVVQPTPNGVSLTWSDGPAAFSSYELSRKNLTAAADAAREALGSVVECYFGGESGEVNSASAKLATAGFGLYQSLFKPGAEQMAQATEIRKWLDKLQSQSGIESLEVLAEGVDPVPWNVVYDRKPDIAAFQKGGTEPDRWQPFWGLRYDLAGGRRVSPLRRYPVLENPRIVVVTDPMVIESLPNECRELTALCRDNGWATATSRAELTEVMQGGRPDILYWLGHTQTEPFGLVLGEEVITPSELRTLMEGDPFAEPSEVFGGVAFLNACGTATANKTETFLDALHPLGLSGYIVTEQSTVDTFASPLGREFLNAFVLRGEPLGRVMRQLRGQVPLGLLYGTYCPPSVRVSRGGLGQPNAGETGPVILTSPATGNRLGRSATDILTETCPLPPYPYRSLQAYGEAERALFAGREEDVLRFAQVLDDPKTRLVVLHGESGVGKTSFLRAGVMPYLEHECVGYRFARDRSKEDGNAVLLVRATNDLVTQIAAALDAYCARPFIHTSPENQEIIAELPSVLRFAIGNRTGPDALRDALRSDPSLLGRFLAELSRKLPFTPVLVIDQAEEVFTLARTPADERNRAQSLEMLHRAGLGPAGYKIVVAMRTEYHGRFTDRLRRGVRDAGGVRDYLLTDFGLDELIEVIRRPTLPTHIEHASEIPGEKYGFRYEDGVAEEIARRARAYTINRQDSVLPLIQVICTQLYDRAKEQPDAVVRLADLDAIGGVEGGMRANAETLVKQLFPNRADQKAFKRLLGGETTQLYIRQADGTLTTALLPADFLARHWTGRMPFAEVLQTASDGAGLLLRVNSLRIGSDDAERPYVSLGHDALAKVAAAWNEELRRWAQLRKYAAALATMAAIVVVLSVLTGWALKQEKRAEEAKDKAVEAENHALEAKDEAIKARDDAERNRQKAVAANELSRKRFRLAQDAFKTVVREIQFKLEDRSGVHDLREQLLRDAEKGLNELVVSAGAVEESEKQQANRLLFWANLQMGDVYKGLGKTDGALGFYTKAVKIADELPKADLDLHRDNSIGYYKLSETALTAGRTAEAIEHALRSLAIRKELSELKTGDRVTEADLAAAHDRVAFVELSRGRTREAAEQCNRSLELRVWLHGNGSDDGFDSRNCAHSFERLAWIQLMKRDTSRALESADQALEYRRQAAADPLKLSSDQVNLAGACALRGLLCYERLDMRGARDAQIQGLNILQELLVRDPFNAVARANEAILRAKLGLTYLRLGDEEKAFDETSMAKANCWQVSQDDPGSARLKWSLAACYEYHAEVLLSRGDIAAALRKYEAGARLLTTVREADPANVSIQVAQIGILERIAEATRRMGLANEAIKTLKLTLNDRQNFAKADPESVIHQRDIALTYDRLAAAHLDARDNAKARENAKQSLSIREKLANEEAMSGGPNPVSAGARRDLEIAHGRLGDIEFADGKIEDAFKWWNEALAISKELARDSSNGQALEDFAIAQERLARGYKKKNQYSDCLDALNAALKLRQQILDANKESVAAQCEVIAATIRVGDRLFAKQNYDDAKLKYEEAEKIARAFENPEFSTRVASELRKLYIRGVLVGLKDQNLEGVVRDLQRDTPRTLILLIESHLNSPTLNPGWVTKACICLSANATSVQDLISAAKMHYWIALNSKGGAQERARERARRDVQRAIVSGMRSWLSIGSTSRMAFGSLELDWLSPEPKSSNPVQTQ